MTVVGSGGRLGCANHRERGTCDNRRTVVRKRLTEQVLAGLKGRLLAPELVEEFIRTYTAEVNAANRERSGRQEKLRTEHARVRRQIENMLGLMRDGGGTRSMTGELRRLEQREDEMTAAITEAAEPEPVPALHPNLADVYRDCVEELEKFLRDPATFAAGAEALRSLIDAVLIYPEEGRGKMRIELRGDLAAFMRLADGSEHRKAPLPAAVAVGRSGNGRSAGVMGTLVAGTGFEPVTFRL